MENFPIVRSPLTLSSSRLQVKPRNRHLLVARNGVEHLCPDLAHSHANEHRDSHTTDLAPIFGIGMPGIGQV